MPRGRPIDWFSFWVHFVCGALVGGAFGLGVWAWPAMEIYDSTLAGVLCIGGGACILGLLAGVLREQFWER